MSAPPTPRSRTPALEKNWRFRQLGTPCEWGESYHPGGLHPLHFGDVLNSHYEIIRKLGDGGFSTVWLALDSVYVLLLSAPSISRKAQTLLTVFHGAAGPVVLLLSRFREPAYMTQGSSRFSAI